MRDFLNSILDFIGSESLTDEEFDAIEVQGTFVLYSKATYDVLKATIEAREAVTGQSKKLKLYFIARGVDVSDGSTTVHKPKSNILIGMPL
jgi:lipocalin